MKHEIERLQKPDGIRLHPQVRSRLRALARRHGINTSTLIRDAIHAKLPEWENSGVHLTSRIESPEVSR